MRHALLALALAAASWSAAHAQGGAWTGQATYTTQDGRRIVATTDERVDRLEAWLKAVDTHEPGAHDAAVRDVGSWSAADLQALWIDVNNLAALMRNVRGGRFFSQRGRRPAVEFVYTSPQMRRMTAFACAAAGLAIDPHCASAITGLDADLRRFAQRAAEERSRLHEDNYLLRRAALLHADVAMAQPGADGGGPLRLSLDVPERMRMHLSDGRELELRSVGVHWELAELALDHVKPSGAAKPAPGSDPMVRQWYRATAAWMQLHQEHDTQHLDRARALFPQDPDILFLSGTQHATYANAAIQAAVREASMPAGVVVDIAGERDERRRAEEFFRRAVTVAPNRPEIRVRLGRVLGELGRHADAAEALRAAVPRLDDGQLRYYGELFLGAEEEALERFDQAHAAYLRAAALRPGAQSPLLALSALARRRGDRAAAWDAMQRLFALPAESDVDAGDPWWDYHLTQAADADALLDDLWRPFRRGAE